MALAGRRPVNHPTVKPTLKIIFAAAALLLVSACGILPAPPAPPSAPLGLPTPPTPPTP